MYKIIEVIYLKEVQNISVNGVEQMRNFQNFTH